MRVGFVVAMESEYAPFLSGLGVAAKTDFVAGTEYVTYVSFVGITILAKCGIGEIAAASATSILIGKYGCDYIVNFGLVGSLDDTKLHSLVAVKDVVHYDCDLTAFGQPLGMPADMKSVYFPADDRALKGALKGLPAVRLASGDKFISDSERKDWIVKNFAANVCDMEGAGIALVCARARIPFSMIKLISDGADEGAVQTFEASKQQAFGSAVEIVLKLLSDRD